MTPFERVHQLIISGKVIGPDGSWISRTEALKEKRALLHHVLSGEVTINGAWTPLSDINTYVPLPEPELPLNRAVVPPPPPPKATRNEYEKETAIMPPPQFDRESIRRAQEDMHAQFAAVARSPSRPIAQESPVTDPDTVEAGVPRFDNAPSQSVPFVPEPSGGVVENPPRLTEPESVADNVALHQAAMQHVPDPAPIVPDGASAPLNPQRAHSPELCSGVSEQSGIYFHTDRRIPRSSASGSFNLTATPSDTDRKSPPDPEPVPDASPVNTGKLPDFSPIQKLEMTARPITAAPDGHSAKDTVTIRTIALGKDASMTISETRSAGTLIAIGSVEGFIDQSNADRFNVQLMSMLEFGVRYFIIDFERTVLIGSAGWGVLAVAARMIKISGGRLVICSMKPEIEESFHLLQFDDVVDARKTPADCIETIRETIESQPVAPQGTNEATLDNQYGESFAELPLPEKIRTIISRNGPLSLMQIAAHLRHDQFGKVKIGLIKLHFLLKDLNLETNWKRVRYYRSC